jgi:hypothetical protein
MLKRPSPYCWNYQILWLDGDLARATEAPEHTVSVWTHMFRRRLFRARWDRHKQLILLAVRAKSGV